MLNFDKLMTLVENSTAMNEQYEDAYPEMSMLEAAAYLPAMITESQLELAESINEQTEKVMSIMTESADPRGDLESLTEASLQGIKERILGFLKKVKEVVMSIINKITQAINMMVKSNKEIVKKYGGKIDEAKCKDLRFEKGYSVKYETFKPHIDAAAFLSSYGPKEVPADPYSQKDFVADMKDKEVSARRVEMVKALTGTDFSGNDKKNWANDYLGKILGEKKSVKYGEGIFTKSTVFNIMTDDKAMSTCKDGYNKILKDAAKKEKEIQRLRDNARADDKEAKGDESAKAFTSVAYECYSMWLQQYQLAYNCVSQAKNAELKAIQIMQKQAKAMFSKMLKASTGKGSEE